MPVTDSDVKMRIFKSLAAGFVGTVIFTFGAILVLVASFSRDLPQGGTIAWDPVSLLGQLRPVTWVILLGVFALCFLWEYRRAGRLTRKS